MKRVHLIITGEVQGVGFRSWTLRVALEAGLTGWVANRAEGIVEMTVEGEEEALQSFIIACRKGPSAAEVKDIQVVWGKATGKFTSFTIRM